MMSSSTRWIEIAIGAVCGIGWLVMAAKGRKNWLASTLNMGAFLVILHLVLSLVMAEKKPDGTMAETPITIFSFGVVIILAFFVATAYMLKQTRRLEIEDKKIFDWAFWMLVCGIVGSRILYAYLNYDHFQANKAEIFKIWHGGLVWYGGLIPGILIGAYLLRKHKLPVLHVADIGAAAVILALGVGRWACLLAGDDYGRETDGWYGIRFYHEQSLIPEGLRGKLLHPTQMYMSVMCLWIFCAVEWIRRRARFAGRGLAAMLILYAVGRGALIEPFRGDFVERNPGYGKHLAVALIFDKPEGSPAVSFKRGARVESERGRKGVLLSDFDLPADAAQGYVFAISDGEAKRETVGFDRGAPNWVVTKIEGLPEGVEFRSDRTMRRTPWYASDLPVPPGYVSTSQWISIFIMIAGVILVIYTRKWAVPGYSEAVALKSQTAES